MATGFFFLLAQGDILEMTSSSSSSSASETCFTEPDDEEYALLQSLEVENVSNLCTGEGTGETAVEAEAEDEGEFNPSLLPTYA